MLSSNVACSSTVARFAVADTQRSARGMLELLLSASSLPFWSIATQDFALGTLGSTLEKRLFLSSAKFLSFLVKFASCLARSGSNFGALPH